MKNILLSILFVLVLITLISGISEIEKQNNELIKKLVEENITIKKDIETGEIIIVEPKKERHGFLIYRNVDLLIPISIILGFAFLLFIFSLFVRWFA